MAERDAARLPPAYLINVPLPPLFMRPFVIFCPSEHFVDGLAQDKGPSRPTSPRLYCGLLSPAGLEKCWVESQKIMFNSLDIHLMNSFPVSLQFRLSCSSISTLSTDMVLNLLMHFFNVSPQFTLF